VSDTEKQVLRALETYKSAVLAKNAETFMHLYDSEVRVFDTWGTWSYEGVAAWRVAVEGWFSSLGSESIRVRFEDVKIVGEQDFALMSAIVTYAANSADGQELRAMQNRISWRSDPVGMFCASFTNTHRRRLASKMPKQYCSARASHESSASSVAESFL
jgi:ketosteroid isomerase-like protein